MSDKSAIQATFSDFRIVKSRKIAQLVCEVPLEQADAALATLGGLPQPAAERWVALAALNVTSIRPQEKRRFEDLQAAMQAGIRCQEPAFQRYLREVYGSEAHADDDEDAAKCVRQLCGVASRSALNLEPRAAAKWRELEMAFQDWMKAPQHA